jgi:hypothetical protein
MHLSYRLPLERVSVERFTPAPQKAGLNGALGEAHLRGRECHRQGLRASRVLCVLVDKCPEPNARGPIDDWQACNQLQIGAADKASATTCEGRLRMHAIARVAFLALLCCAPAFAHSQSWNITEADPDHRAQGHWLVNIDGNKLNGATNMLFDTGAALYYLLEGSINNGEVKVSLLNRSDGRKDCVFSGNVSLNADNASHRILGYVQWAKSNVTKGNSRLEVAIELSFLPRPSWGKFRVVPQASCRYASSTSRRRHW